MMIWMEFKLKLLGYEVDKPSKILIKILSVAGYIKLDIQNIEAPRKMILSSIMYEKTYFYISLEGVLEAIQVSSL